MGPFNRHVGLEDLTVLKVRIRPEIPIFFPFFPDFFPIFYGFLIDLTFSWGGPGGGYFFPNFFL